MQKTKTISIINVKGGVGKSSTALCLSSILSDHLKTETLTIDLDSQNSLSSYYMKGFEGYSIKDVLLDNASLDVVSVGITENLVFIPADINLMSVNQELNLPAKETILSRKLENIKHEYCILDTPPNQNLETSMAIYCADIIIIPTQLNKWSLTSIQISLDWIDTIVKGYQLEPKRVIILPTFYIKNTVTTAVLDLLKENFSSLLSSVVIRRRLDMEKITLMDLDLSEFKTSDVFLDYKSFVEEVLNETR